MGRIVIFVSTPCGCKDLGANAPMEASALDGMLQASKTAICGGASSANGEGTLLTLHPCCLVTQPVQDVNLELKVAPSVLF